jgi:hypothetical protein
MQKPISADFDHYLPEDRVAEHRWQAEAIAEPSIIPSMSSESD